MPARVLSWLCLSALIIALSAVALPRLYAMAFAPDIAPTHMFYSPVKRDFVFREHRGGHDFAYASASGETFGRRAFETSLPFIYYRNMALWGLLPVEIDGVLYDEDAIRDARQVFELKAREIAGRSPQIPVYALLDSDPGKAGLSFPEDVFRMTDDAMEFVHVDANRVDPALTGRFTAALEAAGFAFPAKLVAGRQTILKPFDAGVFLVDAEGAVFHVRRTGDTPVVRRTPIPADLGIRTIKVIENAARAFLGIVLTEDGRLFLLRAESYALVALPVEGYDPDRMDYKLLVNPVAPTAVYGDGAIVRATAMTAAFEPVARHARAVPDASGMLQDRVAKALFPFVLEIAAERGGYLGWRVELGGWPAALTNLLLALGAVVAARLRGGAAGWSLGAALLPAAAGVYGVIALALAPHPCATVRARRSAAGFPWPPRLRA
jgi:hypothetical protein